MGTFEHGGNIHKALREIVDKDKKILDFSANINPLGPPEWLRPLVARELESVVHYPDPECSEFVSEIARNYNISEESVVVGNGTTELLYGILSHIQCKRVVIPVPSYVDYVRAAKIAKREVSLVSLREEDNFEVDFSSLQTHLQPGDLLILGVPNNPTGRLPDRDKLQRCIVENPDVLFLLDEAFLDFIDDYDSFAGLCENVCTMNSMTKFYGVPGLRLGFATMSLDNARQLKDNMPPWTVNSLAQAVGTMALQDRDYQEKSVALCNELRTDLLRNLSGIEQIKVYEGAANYLLVKTLASDTKTVKRYCQEQNILIRHCDNYNGITEPGRFFRIAVRTEKENDRLLETLANFYNGDSSAVKRVKKKPAIMFQGTCSNAGKSILTTALCRIMFQDGFKVAPFKAQNMSLNSFVTLQGDEMGRAQVVQAQAARLDPDCRMNPILLKPNSDTGSQVIMAGHPVDNMSVLKYNDYKKIAWPRVCEIYDSLAADFDAIVLEGAGSPGEVNLKKDDIVNMRMAAYANAPVILVGDIDRGGVYSSFVGIMEVLAEWERNLVAGFLVNKFRGQASLLQSAHDYVQLHTNRPVYGVVPHLKDLGIPEEDSVSFKKGSFNTQAEEEGIDIVVINLPHISNFTDIEPFLDEPDVTIRIVDNVHSFGAPDAVILPGSKNVINDFQFLENENLASKIVDAWKAGTEIVGICGGYQMLGKRIKDPYLMESATVGMEGVSGLSLLPMETVIEKEKNLIRKSGTHLVSGKSVFGYEIHHGISTNAEKPVLEFDDSTACGTALEDNTAWGTYLHGIFDSDDYRRWFIDQLRVRKGLSPVGRILAPYDLENAFDRLADVVRESVDIDALYRLMNV